MENVSNVSSEEELLQLRNEGKISEAEYGELLAAMRKSLTEDTGVPKAKRDLKIVAYIHLCVGIYCIIRFFVLLTQSTFSFEFGILGIPIFFGLLNRRNGWRICAMVLLWFGLIGFPIIFLLGLLGNIPSYFQLFGLKLAQIPSWAVSLGTIPFFLLVLWQYWILTRPKVKALFGIGHS